MIIRSVTTSFLLKNPFILLIFHIFLFIRHTHAIHGINAVSVFRNDEIVYHKYSAILAAAEPFRLNLEDEIKPN